MSVAIYQNEATYEILNVKCIAIYFNSVWWWLLQIYLAAVQKIKSTSRLVFSARYHLVEHYTICVIPRAYLNATGNFNQKYYIKAKNHLDHWCCHSEIHNSSYMYYFLYWLYLNNAVIKEYTSLSFDICIVTYLYSLSNFCNVKLQIVMLLPLSWALYHWCDYKNTLKGTRGAPLQI